MPIEQLAKYSGVMQSDTASTANTVVKRDASADIYCATLHTSAGVNNTGGVYAGIVTKETGYTATTADHTILCDATDGAFEITLPAAAGANGLILHIKKIDASANAVTINGNGSEAIDDDLTVVLTDQWNGLSLHCNSTGWYIIGASMEYAG